MRSKHILVILLLAAVLPIKAQKLAVGLDAVWLATGIVNAGAEMTMGRASTIGLSVMAIQKPWIHHDMKGIALQPEWRYYLSGRPMYHHFIGVGAITGTYNFTFSNKIYNGSAAGLGLTFGYVIALGERFNIDLHSGFGIIHTQDRNWGKNNYTLPTKTGVTLTYIIR